MPPPTAQEVEQAKAELAAAQAVIVANSAILEAAGVSSDATPVTGPRTMEVSAVSLKLPALWPDNPEKWFLHCEGKFRIHRIVSQQTMFDHCIHAMSAEQSDVVIDLMLKGPTNNSYEELKATYLQRRTPTTAERVQRLRALGPLGDRRPSDLLRLIERILGRSIQGDDIATEEFLMRLPGQTQLIVRAQADVFTVEQLAKMADRLISVPGIQSGASVAELHQPTPAPDEPITLASLHRQLSTLASNSDKMSYEVAQLKKATYQLPRSGSRTSAPNTQRRVKMFRGLNDEGTCWYHVAWGAGAHKCIDGCRQAGNGRAGR